MSGDKTTIDSTPAGRQDPRTVVETSGFLDFHLCDEPHKTSVTVTSHPEGIGLQLSTNAASMSVLLLPEDIESLCQELHEAREKTCADDVERMREWVTSDYRDGGDDSDK